ncbi:hypothetical protein WDW86_07415, partial [Bdellovibrionota bacterium FG-2]
MMKISTSRISIVAMALGVSCPAFAVSNYIPTDLSAFTDPFAQSLIQVVAIGADHHAYMPATPLGVSLGFDLGFDVTYVSFPSDFRNALGIGTGLSALDIPAGVPLPKLNIHKGLPLGLDLGFSFMSLSGGTSTLFSSYGGEAKWAFISGTGLPSVAARASFSSNTLFFIQTHTYSLDVLASKDLVVFDPFVGAGMQFWSGDLSIPIGIPGLPATVSSHQSGANPRIYGGIMFKAVFLKLVFEGDYSTSGVSSLGGKLSFGF